MAEKQYMVLNPRGMPPDAAIFSYEEGQWREGDIFTKPRKLSFKDVESLVKRGFLKEVG